MANNTYLTPGQFDNQSNFTPAPADMPKDIFSYVKPPVQPTKNRTNITVNPANLPKSVGEVKPMVADSFDKPTPDVSKVRDAISRTSVKKTWASNRITSQPDVVPKWEKKKEQTIKEKLQQDILGDLEKDTAAEKAELREQANLEEKARVSNRLRNELRSLQVQYEVDKEKIEENRGGGSLGLREYEINKLTSEYNRNSVFKSIEFDIANGDYLSAEQSVNNRIQDLKDEDTRKQNLYSLLFNLIQNDMTDSEKVQADQAFAREQANTEFANQKELMNYQSMLDSQGVAGAPETYTIDNKTMVYDPATGNFTAAPVALPEFTAGTRVRDEDSISEITALINDSYLNNAVGPQRGARLSPTSFFTAGKSNFVADVEKLTASLQLDALTQAKASGATFGALSDAEWLILGKSATVIKEWSKEKWMGKKTEGYQTTPIKMKKELEKIANYARLDYVKKGGIPERVGGTITDDGTFLIKNTDDTYTEFDLR